MASTDLAQIFLIKAVIWIVALILRANSEHWDDKVDSGLHFVSKYVLQIPFLLMTLMGYVTPTLDQMYTPLPPVLFCV